MFNATKGYAQYTQQAQATKLHNPTPTHNYKYTPFVKYVWPYVKVRCMGITLHTPAPNPMYVQTPLNKLAKYL